MGSLRSLSHPGDDGGRDWNEAALTWNNAPFAMENVGRAWVQPIEGCGAPGVSLALRSEDMGCEPGCGASLRGKNSAASVLYSADSDYRHWKILTSSDTGDWNAEGVLHCRCFGRS